MRFLEGNRIELEKTLNDLDRFVIDSISIIQSHTQYVLVGGYVSILFGRSRMSEDIDILIPTLSFEKFEQLYTDFISKGFWCINSSNLEENYKLLKDDHAIRMTRQEWVIPNLEIRFITFPIDRLTLESSITVSLPEIELRVAPLEVQIPYKRIMLGSDKDIEDAIHLEEVFAGKLKLDLMKRFEELIRVEKERKD